VDWITGDVWKEKIEATGATLLPNNDERLDHFLKSAYAQGASIIGDYDCFLFDHLFYVGRHLGEVYAHKPTVRLMSCIATNTTVMDEMNSDRVGLMRITFSRLFRTIGTSRITQSFAPEIREWTDEIAKNPVGLNISCTPEWFQPFREEFDDTWKLVGPTFDLPLKPEYHKMERPGEAGTAVWEPEPSEEDAELLDFIDGSGPPVVYISLGTVAPYVAKMMRMFMNTLKDEDLRLVLSTGKSFPFEKLGPIPPGVIAREYVPQKTMLHKASLFVTHGGMNSTMESLVCGVPLVAIPIASDQWINARQITNLSLGAMLDRRYINADKFKRCVLDVLHNDTIRAKAAECSTKMLAAEPGAKVAARAIREFLET
jgi:UDP:flavonoid glycosyltransferase YjiC (YdhE family)